MRTAFIKLILPCMILTIAASCSISDSYDANRPAQVLEVEARLVRAGFRRVPITTPEQNGAAAQLPIHRLNRYQSARGSVFWYADPTICHCLYEGDRTAYETYAGLVQQERETAEYVNDVAPEQVAYLTPFGYAFPPPVLFGAWPVMLPGGGIGYPGGGGPIAPAGGPGGGIFSHSGHGGGHGGFGHAGGGHR